MRYTQFKPPPQSIHKNVAIGLCPHKVILDVGTSVVAQLLTDL